MYDPRKGGGDGKKGGLGSGLGVMMMMMMIEMMMMMMLMMMMMMIAYINCVTSHRIKKA